MFLKKGSMCLKLLGAPPLWQVGRQVLGKFRTKIFPNLVSCVHIWRSSQTKYFIDRFSENSLTSGMLWAEVDIDGFEIKVKV